MTIVIAARRGEEVLLLADTMVGGDPGQINGEIMPGRLKIITIWPGVTIAFSGLANLANETVRKARLKLAQSGLDAALDILVDSSRDGSVDYIVAAHRDCLQLVRIRNGVTLNVQDICAIGDDAPFAADIEKFRQSPPTEALAKCDLRWRFIDRLLTVKNLGEAIGGFPIAVVAAASGHHYAAHSGAYTFNLPQIAWGETVEQSIDDVYSGRNHIQMDVVPSERQDVPVVGVCLLQARTGWVYSPIEDRTPFRIELAPKDADWSGREADMFAKLRTAIEQHVRTVAQQ